jgi:hypothetical protein
MLGTLALRETRGSRDGEAVSSEKLSGIAIDRADRGLIDADLGGGLIKQRVARSGQGKTGGYRTIVVSWM